MAIDSERINQISEALDVSISTRHCPKQNNLSVIIKGVERNTSNIYEARRILLNLEEKIEASIPESYKIPNPPKIFDVNGEYFRCVCVRVCSPKNSIVFLS